MMSDAFDYLVNDGDKAALLKAQLEHMGGYLELEISENAKLRAEIERLTRERDQSMEEAIWLREAIQWACGAMPDDKGDWFGERPAGAGAYWWRRNLTRMADAAALKASETPAGHTRPGRPNDPHG